MSLAMQLTFTSVFLRETAWLKNSKTFSPLEIRMKKRKSRFILREYYFNFKFDNYRIRICKENIGIKY